MKTATISREVFLFFMFITLVVHINQKHPHPNQISFPLVGVDPGIGTASAFILKKEFGNEYETIMAAALRNRCQGESLLILFAVRKAENGGPGTEFGIECQRGTDLDTQAGWAAATIVKNRERWNGEGDFIAFLSSKYCPLNSEVWIKNVTYWFRKFKKNK